ncbi:hypothetical protein BGZ57DRAFT_181480 [Hyaloscypha finlandica]|nr:hypothetical protein BGZ57DRAFT_181480 [Hyaloscypha finlandica]
MISLCAASPASPANGRPGAGRGIRKGVVPWAALGLEKKLYAGGLDLFRRLHDVWLTLVLMLAAGGGSRSSDRTGLLSHCAFEDSIANPPLPQNMRRAHGGSATQISCASIAQSQAAAHHGILCCRRQEPLPSQRREQRLERPSYLSMPNDAAQGFTLEWLRWYNGRYINQREVAANRGSQDLPRRHWVLEGRIGISFCPWELVRGFSGWDVVHLWGDQHPNKSLTCLSRIRRTEEIGMIDGTDGRA